MKIFKRFGVRAALLLAFVVISGFAVLATVAAMYSFQQVQTLFDKITEQRVPTALAAQELSSRVGRILAETPTLLAASTPLERSQIWSRIGTEIEAIDNLLLVLRNRGFPADTLTSLNHVLDSLRSNLFSLYTLVGERIVLAETKAILLDEMLKEHEETMTVLGPWIINVNNDVRRQRAAVDDSRLPAADRSTSETELIASLTLLASLQQILQSVTEIHASLLGAASAEKQERLDLLKLRTQWSMEALRTLATAVGAQPRQLILAELEYFRRFAEGENNMPLLRARELALISNGEAVQRENTRLSRELSESIEWVVRDTQRDISQATSEAHAVRTGSSITLILIVSLSLASSVLIVWLYVGRNLIARLTALSNSMMEIAGGNLGIPLPPVDSDEIGRMAAALAVFRDTAVEVKEKNLREIAEARQRLVDAIESISEGFALYDKDDRLVLSNSRYRELMHPGTEDISRPGTLFADVIRAAAERGLVSEAQGRIEEWVAQRLAQHRDPAGPHVQRRDKDRWIQISERKTAEGSTVAVYTDISELKQHETALSKLVEALEVARDNAMEAARVKSKFLANMSHELRTPLNAIIGFSEVLLERMFGEMNEKQEDYLKDIHSSGQHLLSLINDILDLAKVEAGRMELNPTTFDLSAAIDNALTLIRERAMHQGIALATEIDSQLGELNADERKLKQILLNLLSNAVKFTPEGGRITVGARRLRDMVEIAVNDTGIGIAPKDQAAVFEEFKQVGRDYTRKAEGTGLGLALTRKLVELHGGAMRLESEPGKGSTFSFTLPLKAAVQNSIATSA